MAETRRPHGMDLREDDSRLSHELDKRPGRGLDGPESRSQRATSVSVIVSRVILFRCPIRMRGEGLKED